MNNFFKTPLFLTLSLIVNIILFLLIHYLVTNDIQSVHHYEKLNWVDFVQLKQQQNLEPEKQQQSTPDKPPPPEEVPEVPEFKQPDISEITNNDLSVESPDFNIPLPAPGSTGVPYIGDYLKSASPGKQVSQLPEIATDLAPLDRVEPTYPPRALRAGIEGSVVVEFTITTSGDVKDLKIVSADPPDVFDNSVLKAVAKWKFSPQLSDGNPVEQRARQEIKFSLRR